MLGQLGFGNHFVRMLHQVFQGAVFKRRQFNRIAIHESLVNDDDLQRLIVSNPSRDQLNEHLEKKGFESLFSDGLERVKAQETTMEEILSVVNS